MTDYQTKILTCGDVYGNFTQLYSRVEAIQKKAGKFDCLFCVGDFFGESEENWTDFQKQGKVVPVPTFILGPNKLEHKVYYAGSNEKPELHDNITYLGRKGVYKTSSNLTVAYLSGLETSTGESSDIYFNQSDVTSLITIATKPDNFMGVDILLTSQWPEGVEKYSSSNDIKPDTYDGSQLISNLALTLKPRYHFVGLHNQIYERQPYRNHVVLAESQKHVTRFISLAKVANKEKKKYIYAFNITPMATMNHSELITQPIDVTECPYKNIKDFSSSEKQVEISPYFFDSNSDEKARNSKKRNLDRDDQTSNKKKPNKPTGPCWFCLGSPEVEKHLVISVGLHTYLVLAKGAMTPHHTLILPIMHHQSIVMATSDVISEIDQYKECLKKCFNKLGKSVVFYERNYRTQHLQIQAIPVPMDCKFDLIEAFMTTAEENGINLTEIPKYSDLTQIVPSGAPYFYLELPSGVRYLHRIKSKFPLQFGREALASARVLNTPERVDWRECKYTHAEECDMVTDFKTIFKPYDFALSL